MYSSLLASLLEYLTVLLDYINIYFSHRVYLTFQKTGHRSVKTCSHPGPPLTMPLSISQLYKAVPVH